MSHNKLSGSSINKPFSLVLGITLASAALAGCGDGKEAGESPSVPATASSTSSPSSPETTTSVSSTPSPSEISSSPSSIHDPLMDFDPMIDTAFPVEIDFYQNMSLDDWNNLSDKERKSYVFWRYDNPYYCNLKAPNDWANGYMPGWKLADEANNPINIASRDNTAEEILAQFRFERQVAWESCKVDFNDEGLVSVLLDKDEAVKMASGYTNNPTPVDTIEVINKYDNGEIIMDTADEKPTDMLTRVSNDTISFPVTHTYSDGRVENITYTFQWYELDSSVNGKHYEGWNLIDTVQE